MSYTPLNNIILAGDPRGVTASPGDNDTSLATTEFVQGEVGNYLPLAGGTMTGDIDLDEGVDLNLAADGVVAWDDGAAMLSYDAGDDVILSDSPIRVSIAPSDGNDLVNKDYVDGVATGLDVKASCRVASIAPITLAGPGANIDGVAMNNGDRVLVKNQGDAEENGIYVFNGAAVAMTRAEDADEDAEVTAGMFTFIAEGTHADQGWVLTTNDVIDVGVTELAFSQFSNAVIVSTLDSLTDVDVSGVVQHAGLRYDGSGWVDTVNILFEDGDSKIVLGGDANLYRSQANILKTDDALDVADNLYMSGTDSKIAFAAEDTATNPILTSNVGVEATSRFAITAKGDLAWGDGTNPVDVSLSRYAADVLLTPDTLAVGSDISLYGTDSDISFTMQDDATNVVMKAKLSADTQQRLQIQVDGKILLGDGSNAADVNLYRSAADVLKTDDNFEVGNDLDVFGSMTVGGVSDLQAGVRFSAITNLFANATLDPDDDHIILADSSGGAFTITLPAAPATGTIYQIKDAGGAAEAENITIDGDGNDIDGDPSILLSVNYQSATLVYDGVAWHLI